MWASSVLHIAIGRTEEIAMKIMPQMFRQTRHTLSLLAMLLFTANKGSAGLPMAPSHLQYAIAYARQSGKPCLDVSLTFAGDASGASQLTLPSGTGPGAVAYPNIVDVQAVSAGTTITHTDKPQAERITYSPGQTVRVRYRIRVTDAGQQLEHSYSPEVQADHVSILGLQLFAIPGGSMGRPLTVDVDWDALPPGWTVADSFGIRQTRQTFSATPETLGQSIWAAGDYRLLRTLVRGRPVFLAVRGKWPAPDTQILATFSRVLSVERGFWHDNGPPSYLIVFNPNEGDNIGISFPSSFYEAGPLEEGLSFEVERIFAHEAFHAWLPYRITLAGPASAHAWFYEGFTDSYAPLFLLRSGLITPAKYADDCNEVIRDYETSPFRSITEAQYQYGLEHGFSDYRGQQIVYRRGYLLALHWNALIRKASRGKYSLDDVMRTLLLLAQKSKQPLPSSDLVSVMRRYAHQDVSGDISRYCVQGRTLAPDPAALGPCASLAPTKVTLYDLGFDGYGSSQQGKILGVKPASNAYRAGLRDGQTYVDADYEYKNPAKQARITIKDQGTQRVVAYYPAGQTLEMPQYKLKPDASENTCLSWFGIASPPAQTPSQ